MDYIIKRKEAGDVEKEKSWLLVYGRRKTGKTFLLRNFCRLDGYFLVKRDLSIFSDEKQITLGEMSKAVKELLNRGKRVAIDEFQRLDESFLEEFTLLHPKGKLVISGSSMRIVKKFFEPRSALLGFFTPMKIGFISPMDVLSELKEKFTPAEAIELATFVREPWLIPLFGGENITEFVYKVVTKSKVIISSLIGEVFGEEERELSKKYEAILSLIGSGVWNTKEIASIMYSRRLIPDPSVTNILQYIKNLEEMGLLEGIKIFNSKSNFYRLSSPIMNIYYYLESRYNISNREVSLEEVKPTLERLINLEIQNFIADFFAEKNNGRKEYYMSPQKEFDFVITRRNRLEIVGEVKWKKVEAQDVEKFRKNTEDLSGRKVIIFKHGKLKESMNAEEILSDL
ncbi:MAG: AAA family ATPase [Candidatus Hydrothermarchaeota archaeon]|nr:AAA family ATPase [Candidatus Hydrothermarchaeota archaeon]